MASPAAAQGGFAVDGGQGVWQAGGQVRPAAPVPGDFRGAGGSVLIDQPVSGNAALAGGSIAVRAPIGGNLRVGGGGISIEAPVAGALHGVGGSITLAPGASVGRGASLYAGDIALAGRIEQGLTARARHILIDGPVQGDAQLAAERVELGPNARISGNVRYTSGAPLVLDPGAQVSGAVQRQGWWGDGAERPEPGGTHEWHWQVAGFWLALASFLVLLALAALLLLVAGGPAARSADAVRRRPGLALLFGLGIALGVPLAAVLLVFTLVGIPLAFVLVSLYPVLLLLGGLLGVLALARLLSAALRRGGSPRFALDWLFFALALLIVMLAASVPWVGGWIVTLLVLAGLGGLVPGLRR